jgi:hypothetical protein
MARNSSPTKKNQLGSFRREGYDYWFGNIAVNMGGASLFVL